MNPYQQPQNKYAAAQNFGTLRSPEQQEKAPRTIDNVIRATLLYSHGHSDAGDRTFNIPTVSTSEEDRLKYVTLYEQSPLWVRRTHKDLLAHNVPLPQRNREDYQRIAESIAANTQAIEVFNALWGNLQRDNEARFMHALTINLGQTVESCPTLLDFEELMLPIIARTSNLQPQAGTSDRQALAEAYELLCDKLYGPEQRDCVTAMEQAEQATLATITHTAIIQSEEIEQAKAAAQIPSPEKRQMHGKVTFREELVLPPQTANTTIDQGWYTWSRNGLDNMAMGYRIRAASGDLHNSNGMRNRVLDRYIRFEAPAGLNINTLDAQTTPTNARYKKTNQDKVLVKSRFLGQDLAGRNSVFFSHYETIPLEVPEAPTPIKTDFGPREAIVMLRDENLWDKNENNKAPNDTTLPRRTTAQAAERYTGRQTVDVDAIAAYLPVVIDAFLRDPKAKIILTAQESVSSDLIWGLTHALSREQIKDLTFSTNESQNDITLDQDGPEIIGTVGVEAERAFAIAKQLGAGYGVSSLLRSQATVIDCYIPTTTQASSNAIALTQGLLAEITRRQVA